MGGFWVIREPENSGNRHLKTSFCYSTPAFVYDIIKRR